MLLLLRLLLRFLNIFNHTLILKKMETTLNSSTYKTVLVFKGHQGNPMTKVISATFQVEFRNKDDKTVGLGETAVCHFNDAQISVSKISQATPAPRSSPEARPIPVVHTISGLYSRFKYTAEEFEALRDTYILPLFN